MVENAQPDLIVITGDLIDQESQYDALPALMDRLTAIAPTYYVTGNHEWAVRKVNVLKDLLREHGVRVLSDEYEPVSYTHLDVYKRQPSLRSTPED